MPTGRVGSSLKAFSRTNTAAPLCLSQGCPGPTEPMQAARAPGRGSRGAGGHLGGAEVPPHRSPRSRPRGHFVASKGGGGERQAAEPAPSGHCSPSCPSTSAPAGGCGGRHRPPRPLPSRRVCGERFWAAPRPPPSPPAPGHLRQGQALLGVQAAAPPLRGPRRGPGGRAAGGGDGQWNSPVLPSPAGLGGFVSN